MLHRNSYVEIDLNNIQNNIEKIIKNNNDYKYYFGVVKANAYSHGLEIINYIIKGGVNYLAVATLDEALLIRKKFNDIPILCLGIIPIEFINLCSENNITITISNKKYLDDLLKQNIKKLKVHLKINTGMNRLGFNDKKEINYAYKKIKESNLYLEGIYSHIYEATNKTKTNNQYKTFEYLTNDINLNEIDIIHINASDAMTNFKKKEYMNGCRLGIIMYGITNKKELKLSSTFKLYSEVIQINDVKKGQTVGYNGIYTCTKNEKIAVIPIGYADGIIRKNTGRYVFIKDKKYKIVGNICMDMLFVKVDNKIKVHDKVAIIKDNDHLNYIAKYLETIPYEVLCSISPRVERIYK